MVDQKRRGPMGRSTSHSRPPRGVLVMAAMLALCGLVLLFTGALALADDGDPSTGIDTWRFGVAPEVVLPRVVGDPAIADMAVGEQITVDIVVQDVVNLAGFQIQMSYDPSVVQLGDGDPIRTGFNASVGDFLSSPFVARNIITNTLGTLDVAVAQIGGPHPTGTGTLFSLIVQAVAPGDAGFVFDLVQLVDGDSLAITSTSTAPNITVLSDATTPTASSTSTATKTSTPTSTLTSTATSTRTATPTNTATSTHTATPTNTTTSEPTDTATATLTKTSTPTSTSTADDTATDAPTPTQTATSGSSLTPSSTPTATATHSATATRTATPQGPFFYLDPQTTVIGLGETFDVMIYADSDGEAISGVEAHLQWDPSKLEVTGIAAGNTFQGYNTYTPLSGLDNGAGTLWYAHGMVEQFCLQGEWLVATVTFRTLNYGATALDFGAETQMACSGLDIQPTWVAGQVSVLPPGVTPSATPTESAEPPTETPTATATPTVRIICSDQVVNGGFEQERTGWDWVSEAGAYTQNPHSGAFSAWLAGYNSASDAVQQSFALPSDAITATLSYWWHVETIESEHPYDYMYVELVHGGITTTLAVYSDGDVLNTWHQAGPYDLMAYADQTVKLVFRAVTDGKAYSNFYVDDVELIVCAPDQGPTPPGARKVYVPLVFKGFSAAISQ